MNEENSHDSQVLEVDTVGGWLVTHHTRTWDTRLPLTQIDEKISAAQANVVFAQQQLDNLQAQKMTIENEKKTVADAQAATPQ